MKLSEIALAANLATGWKFPSVPGRYIQVLGAKSLQEACAVVARLYARHALN